MRLIEDLGTVYATGISKVKVRHAIYECPFCGKYFQAAVNHINDGHTKSCGCMKVKHGLRDTKLFGVWWSMRARCYNKNTRSYADYGARGIIVCDTWKNSFKSFYDWAVLNGYKEGLQIDRKNNDGNYEPSNCRFVDGYINAQNKGLRRNNSSGYTGVSKIRSKWLSYITYNNKRYRIGLFETKEDAALAYNKFVIEHHSCHKLNII